MKLKTIIFILLQFFSVTLERSLIKKHGNFKVRYQKKKILMFLKLYFCSLKKKKLTIK